MYTLSSLHPLCPYNPITFILSFSLFFHLSINFIQEIIEFSCCMPISLALHLFVCFLNSYTEGNSNNLSWKFIHFQDFPYRVIFYFSLSLIHSLRVIMKIFFPPYNTKSFIAFLLFMLSHKSMTLAAWYKPKEECWFNCMTTTKNCRVEFFVWWWCGCYLSHYIRVFMFSEREEKERTKN